MARRALASSALLVVLSVPFVVVACGEDVVDGAPDAEAPRADASTTTPRDAATSPNPGADAAPPADAAEAAAPASDASPPPVSGSDCTETKGCAITVAATVGATSEGGFGQGTEVLDRPRQPGVGIDYDACYTGGAFPLRTHYAYVELRNPSASDLTVEVRLDSPPDGAWVYTYAAAYGALPKTTAERDACVVNDGCPVATGLAEPRWPCLLGGAAPTIPKNGSIFVYVPSHSPPSQPAGATPARFVLRATVTKKS